MNSKTPIILIIVLILALLIAKSFLYTVSETEQVVITQFGDFKRAVKDAGIKVKTPILEQVNVFDKRILEWDGNPTQVPTLDKRYIWVDCFARWRIEDPLKFFQTVRDERTAHSRLDDIVNGAVRNQISNHLLIETVRTSNRPMQVVVSATDERSGEIQNVSKGRVLLTRQILEEAAESATQFGIEIIDVQLKRINYVEEVRKAVYERMIVERQRIAAKYRSEGEGKMMEISGAKEMEEKRILSEAYRAAEEIRGKADGEAIKIYAEAYSQDPEFYSFLKTLESYEQNIGSGSTLILSTESDYLKYLKAQSLEK